VIIRRVLNNSVIDALDDELREVIVLGKGIGFGAVPGSTIDAARIEKVFRLDDTSEGSNLARVAAAVPAPVLAATDEIVAIARRELTEKLSDSIYAALADHLAFALERSQQNVSLASALENEVRAFYPKEYAVAQQGLEAFAASTGDRLPAEEATNIALHLITAQVGGSGSAAQLTELTQSGLEIVRLHFGITYDHDDPSYARFVTHVRYFAQRVLTGRTVDRADDELLDMLTRQMPAVFDCVARVETFVHERHGHTMSSSEKVYIAMHVSRFV
jgi:beta-glucoside operon transcriptional antiterminator